MRVNYHSWVLSVWIKYIFKFDDKTLPRKLIWKLKHEKTFIFCRKTQTKRKQIYSVGAGAFRHVSKASFICVFKPNFPVFKQHQLQTSTFTPCHNSLLKISSANFFKYCLLSCKRLTHFRPMFYLRINQVVGFY